MTTEQMLSGVFSIKHDAKQPVERARRLGLLPGLDKKNRLG
jgi:hypothetical protein